MRNKKLKVVIDTGIFISGLFQNNENCINILNLVEGNKLILYFSQETIGELIYIIKNFARYNIDDENERIELLYNIAELFYFSMSTNTMNTKIQSCKDKYDNMFLKCASEGKVNFLISDDIKSGLHNIELGKTKILTSDDFIKRYYNK